MTILEENFKWHLEAFASELFIYTYAHSISQKWVHPSYFSKHVSISTQGTILGYIL